RPAPAWTRDGAFLVVRKLEQDVPGFWRFAFAEAASLAQQPGFAGMSAERLAALMVGRWKSGAPLARTPRRDIPTLGADAMENNRFGYAASSSPFSARSPERSGAPFPEAAADERGVACPHAAHIRKMNPRDLDTVDGGAADTLTRLLLRRGIPYGPALANPLAPTRAELRAPRGLMYLSYQASIGDQFEFLMRRWANRDDQPQGGGVDPIIGQGDDAAGKRMRRIVITGTGGRAATLELRRDWVHAAGGGYFFAPSLTALRDVLAG
ncbi:MAG: Dyp-type peroxidase, partial [Aromatoleum sp.]|nr:Dyp-type peroxidase [Aromatoleum sp.]